MTDSEFLELKVLLVEQKEHLKGIEGILNERIGTVTDSCSSIKEHLKELNGTIVYQQKDLVKLNAEQEILRDKGKVNRAWLWGITGFFITFLFTILTLLLTNVFN